VAVRMLLEAGPDQNVPIPFRVQPLLSTARSDTNQGFDKEKGYVGGSFY
jgi:hypothetical protein